MSDNGIDVGSILGTVGGDISKVWGAVTSVLPKNGDGSIDWGKVGGDIVGFIKDNKSTILDGLNVLNQTNRTNQSNKYANMALSDAKNTFASNQPLRDAGRAGLLNPKANAPDLSNLKNLAGPNSGNPFAGAIPLAPPTGGAPIPPSRPPVIPAPTGPASDVPGGPPPATGWMGQATTPQGPPATGWMGQVPGAGGALPLAPMAPASPLPPTSGMSFSGGPAGPTSPNAASPAAPNAQAIPMAPGAAQLAQKALLSVTDPNDPNYQRPIPLAS